MSPILGLAVSFRINCAIHNERAITLRYSEKLIKILRFIICFSTNKIVEHGILTFTNLSAFNDA